MGSLDPDVLAVTYGTLHDAAGTLRKKAADVAQAITDLETAAKKVHEHWQGEAGSGFSSEMKRWQADATKIKHQLEKIAQAMSQAPEQYSHADKKAASLIPHS